MTIKETERLARLEQQVTDLDKKVDAGFRDVIDRIDRRSALTRWAVGTLIGIAAVIATAWGSFKS